MKYIFVFYFIIIYTHPYYMQNILSNKQFLRRKIYTMICLDMNSPIRCIPFYKKEWHGTISHSKESMSFLR